MKSALILGCGNMGSAIAQGLLEKRIFERQDLTLVERRQTPQTLSLEGKGVKLLAQLSDLAERPELVILAVKPQDSGEAMDHLAERVGPETLIISIMAGVTLAKMRQHLPQGKLIRAMPNTPSAILQGMTTFCGDPEVGQEELAIAQVVLGALGVAMEVENESFIDASTAVSGSGPAYVFYLAEAMMQAALNFGFAPKDARQLVTQTVMGAATLLASSDEEAGDLRAKVTSKGGTTEAALNVFEDRGVKDGLIAGIEAAKARSEELGRG
ncbi:MAG: pyrroline-5-carboxylate reductase [bacterium]|nr:pyrroline-5-carboxylate reductase [bacterium]